MSKRHSKFLSKKKKNMDLSLNLEFAFAFLMNLCPIFDKFKLLFGLLHQCKWINRLFRCEMFGYVHNLVFNCVYPNGNFMRDRFLPFELVVEAKTVQKIVNFGRTYIWWSGMHLLRGVTHLVFRFDEYLTT